MKKLLLKVLMIVYTLQWLIVSAINYTGVFQQIKTDFMGAFVWSLFIFMAYLLILYAGSLLVGRFYYVMKYRNVKDKFMDIPALFKQMILFTAAVLYAYGLCNQASYYIGLVPIMLFFYKKFLQIGKFYIYQNGRLIYMDERSREYEVKNITSFENKVVIQIMRDTKLKTLVLNHKKYRRETAFLNMIYLNNSETKEVA